jgi:hypothetical protein
MARGPPPPLDNARPSRMARRRRRADAALERLVLNLGFGALAHTVSRRPTRDKAQGLFEPAEVSLNDARVAITSCHDIYRLAFPTTRNGLLVSRWASR